MVVILISKQQEALMNQVVINLPIIKDGLLRMGINLLNV